ncbi:MAG: sigma-70 family RNA polymerase sigma factor [Bacteroidota bacterium]
MDGIFELEIKVKSELRMGGNQTVSSQAILAEWDEIQAAQREPALFRPLYDRYYDRIFRYIFKRTVDENLAADLCSQVFLKAMQKLSGYKFKGVPFSAWLYRIAGNEVTQHFRNTGKQRVVSIQESDVKEMIDEVPEDDITPSVNAMLSALHELPEKDMNLIELRFFEHRPFKEIAQILNITESNAKVKTYRILERMKKIILTKT